MGSPTGTPTWLSSWGTTPTSPSSAACPPIPQPSRRWSGSTGSAAGSLRGLSFAIADAESDNAVGAIGLWLQNLSAGRATAGYAVCPGHRGRGIATSALTALTTFAWTIPALHRVELYIEPWNNSSIHVAEASGYQREGLLRSHQEIGDTRRDMLLYATTRPHIATVAPVDQAARRDHQP